MKLTAIIIFAITFCFHSTAQELVKNGDFEDYSSCPNNSGQIERADHWINFGETPDYFNSCSSNTGLQVPNNIGGSQFSISGNGYAAFFPVMGEYLGTELETPLVIGETYTIEFNVSLALNDASNIGVASSHLGAKFSNTTYSTFSPPSRNNVAHVYDSTIITDTLAWTTITGEFQADSAYQYLIIGNFFDANTFSEINVGTNPSNRSYYYLENVSVKKSEKLGLSKNKISEIFINYNAHSNELMIESENENSKIQEINLYTITGQTIKSFNPINANILKIDASAMNSGIYFCHVLTSEGKVFKLKFRK